MSPKIIAAVLAGIVAACTPMPDGTFQTPGDRMASMRANVENQMINLYGYQAYADCRGRGLSLTSSALMYCLDAHGFSQERIDRERASN